MGRPARPPLIAPAGQGYHLQRLICTVYVPTPKPQIAPTGMVFIPCRNGWSHRPDEFAAPADIGRGIEVLALALAQLAGGSGAGADHAEL